AFARIGPAGRRRYPCVAEIGGRAGARWSSARCPGGPGARPTGARTKAVRRIVAPLTPRLFDTRVRLGGGCPLERATRRADQRRPIASVPRRAACVRAPRSVPGFGLAHFCASHRCSASIGDPTETNTARLSAVMMAQLAPWASGACHREQTKAVGPIHL